ncbi:hypothetical protein VTO42DRAFT_8828 [Malbranchea cinnamomea]
MFALPPRAKDVNSNSAEAETPWSQTPTVTPNILPCRIQHDGPVPVSRRYWNPIQDEGNEDQATAYFRGRKLRGTRVRIPEGYCGLIATTSTTKLQKQSVQTNRQISMPPIDVAESNWVVDDQEEEEDKYDEEQESETTLLDTHGKFTHIQIWKHEKLPGPDDVFAKGLNEWIRFAETIHSDRSTSTTTAQNEVERRK